MHTEQVGVLSSKNQKLTTLTIAIRILIVIMMSQVSHVNKDEYIAMRIILFKHFSTLVIKLLKVVQSCFKPKFLL